jgi:hypothetical protein
MKDHLIDLVKHTHDLGSIGLIKIIGDDAKTKITGIADDQTVVLNAEFTKPIEEFNGVFGMPNLNNLKTILNTQEYKNDAVITVTRQDRKEEKNVPVGLHFDNKNNDFSNDYRFMSSEMVQEQLNVGTFKGATWDVEFNPTELNIQRLKMQSQINHGETVFKTSTVDGNLILSLGDQSNHNGSFTFQSNVGGSLSQSWSWPIKPIISILSLDGDKTMKISDKGATEIVVDSGLATYNYIIPARK